MPKIKITGVKPFDGEYDVDGEFTNRDWHTIKQLTGLRPGEVNDAAEQDDNDLVVAFAVICLRRAGHDMTKQAIDHLWDAKYGAITILDDVEADASPPPETSAGDANEPSAKNGSSGTGGNSDGASLPVNDQSFTGAPV